MQNRYADLHQRSGGSTARYGQTNADCFAGARNDCHSNINQFAFEEENSSLHCSLADRVDSLSQKLLTNDDKIVNLTKLLKLTQSLQEEREFELKKEIDEIRHRNRKVEQMNARLTNDVEDIRTKFSEVSEENRILSEKVRGTMQRNHIEEDQEILSLKQKVQSLTRDLQDVYTNIERRVSDIHEDIANQIQTVNMTVTQRMSNDNEQRFDNIRSSFDLQLNENVQRVNSMFSNVNMDISNIKASLENGVAKDISALEASLYNVRTEFEKILTDHVNNVEDGFNERYKDLNERLQTIHVSMSEYVHNYREHVTQNTQKTDEICDSLKQLLDVHDTTRAVLSGDMESLKDWMQKTAQKLKNKLEILAVEVKGVKEDHVKFMVDTIKQRTQTNQKEKDALMEILASKSSESALMNRKVEDHIRNNNQGIELTSKSSRPGSPSSKRHTQTPPPPHTRTRSTPPLTSVHLETFLEKSKARRQQLDDMCLDLAKMESPVKKRSDR